MSAEVARAVLVVSLAQELEAGRHRCNLDVRQVARSAELSDAAVVAFELGQRAPTNFELFRLAATLGLDYAHLVRLAGRLDPATRAWLREVPEALAVLHALRNGDYAGARDAVGRMQRKAEGR